MHHVSLECSRDRGGALQVRISGRAARSFDFQWQALPQFRQLLKFGREDPAASRQLGESLRNALLPAGWEDAELTLEEGLRTLEGATLSLISAEQEFLSLPWELVRLGGSHGPGLGRIPRLTIRYAAAVEDALPGEPVQREGGRIVFGYADFDPGVPHPHHLAGLRKATRAARLPLAPADIVPKLSRARLRRAFENGEPPTVLHLLCQASRGATGFGLRFVPEVGADECVLDGADLAELLAPWAESLRLVVLSAISRDDQDLNEPLASFAAPLRAAGVQAVLCQRLPMLPSDTIVLAESLYDELFVQIRSLQEAVDRSRAKLVEHSAGLGWAALQLHAPLEPVRPIVFRPFRGLLPFTAHTRRFYAGRRAELHELLWRVTEAAAGRRPGLQILAGAAGVGKTSLVRAGLIPALRDDERRWRFCLVRPDASGLRGLRRFQREWKGEDRRRGLVVVDPLEELFPAWESEPEREGLLGTLWNLAETRGVVVLGVLGAAHASRFASIPGGRRADLASLVFTSYAHRMWLAPMDREALEEVIRAPLEQVGLALDDDAIEALASEAASRSWGLPLLQHGLDAMWQARWKNKLEPDFHDPLEAPLRDKLAQAFAGLEDEALRQTAMRVLLRLIDHDPEAPPFSLRTRTRAELEGELGTAAGLVLAHLEELGLLAIGGEAGQVSLAHPCLLRFWPELATALRAERALLDEVGRLRQAAIQWQQLPEARASARLLRGSQLGHARYLRGRCVDDFPEEVEAWIEASEKAEDTGLINWHDALCMRAYHLLQKRKPRLAALFLGEVQNPRTLPEWRQAAIDLLLRGNRPQSTRTASAVTMRMWFPDGKEHPIHLRHVGRVRTAQFTPDGSRVITVSMDGATEVWSADGAGRHRVLGGGTGLGLGGGHFASLAQCSPDGKHVLTGSPDGAGRIWSLVDAADPHYLSGHKRLISAASFAPGGGRIATVSYDGSARLWSLEGDAIRIFQSGREPLVSVEFSRDGERLATATQGGRVSVWSADGSERISVFEHASKLLFASFSPDGRALLAASIDGVARLWPLDGGEPRVYDEGSGKLWSAQLSPDGRLLATGRDDGVARVWRLGGEQPPRRLLGHTGPLWSVEFSPDGAALVTSSDDGTARVWPVEEEGDELMLVHREEVLTAHFSPGGDKVLTVSGEAAVVWRISEESLSEFLKQMRPPLSQELRGRYLTTD